jgi:hypothetical protein
VGGLAPAPAQRLDLQQLHPVGELDEPARPGEELGPEVGGDPEGVHVDAELVDEPGQLLDLHGGVELRLVTDEVVHPDALGEPPTTVSQKSRSSETSIAGVDRPSREESTDSPMRSSLVKISPCRPRAELLWSICRARVDLPQSIVPEKNTSSATRRHPRRRRPVARARREPTPRRR